jgi:NTE family protein
VRFSRLLAAAKLWGHARSRGAILDTMPLVDTLHRHVSLAGIEASLQAGALDAVAVTASSYTTGVHWTFCHAGGDRRHDGWDRPGRRAEFQPLTIEHLMASSAIPFLFPATPLWVDGRKEYFGDGSMRQIAPVSPALHLGADRVLIVGTGRQTEDQARARSNVYPSLAQIAGHALNSIFLDSLMVDIERMERINRTVKLIPPEAQTHSTLRPIKVLFITPSQPLERIAARFLHELPRTVRFILRPTGALNRSGSNLASYLLFEESFCRALIDLGYQDTVSREAEVRDFFDLTEGRAHA